MKRFVSQWLLLAVMSLSNPTIAQEGTPRGSLIILREQAAGIADQVVDSLQLALPSPGRVSVFIAGAAFVSIIENAFLDGLQRKSLVVRLSSEANEEPPSLRLQVLQQGLQFRELQGGLYLRSVTTTLEANVEGNDGNSRYLGMFHRIQSDTVSEREDLLVTPSRSESRNSFVEKILEPAVVIAGAALVVYLFFTVRN